MLDYMLLLASNGCAGVNMETGVNQLGFVSSYSPIFENADGSLTARPEYAGMLAFRQAVQGGGTTMIASELDAGGANVTALEHAGEVTAVVINKDAGADVTLRIEGTALSALSVTRLSAPSLEATRGVTLGGAAVTGAPARLSAGERSAGPEVRVPRGSAALLRLRR